MPATKRLEVTTFRCGHVRDSFNTKRNSKGGSCRTCHRAYNRARYRRLREEGLAPYEIKGYAPLTEGDLHGMLQRMQGGMTMCQATAGPSGYQRSTLYRKLRIWAPSNRDRIMLIKRLSSLNVATQRRHRWEARQPRFEPGMFPRIDPAALDYGRIEPVLRLVVSSVELQNELRQALIIDLLEGRCCYENLQIRARQFLDEHFRQSHSKYGLTSMDQPLYRDGTGNFVDLVAWKAWEH